MEPENRADQTVEFWQPSICLGLSLIFSAAILLLSFTDPREVSPAWDSRNDWNLRVIAGHLVLPSVKNWNDFDMFAAEEVWACFGDPECPVGSLIPASESSSAPKQKGSQRSSKQRGSKKQQKKARQPDVPPAQQPKQKFQQKSEDSDESCSRHRAKEKIELGVNLSLIPGTGWGTLAYEIFFGFLQDNNSSFDPIFLGEVHPDAYKPASPYSTILPTVLSQQRDRRSELLAKTQINIPVLHAVDHVYFHRSRLVGSPNFALIFFDKTDIFPHQIAAAHKHFDAVVVGSQWNADTIRELGLTQIPVITVLQGVDERLFFPRNLNDRSHGDSNDVAIRAHGLGTPLEPDRDRLIEAKRRDGWREKPAQLRGAGLVVFSGGKFEMRKAQDIVVNTFKRFREAVPSAAAKLIFTWDNPWPVGSFSLGGASDGFGTARGMPERGAGGKLDFVSWLESNGVARDDVVDLGSLSKESLAAVLRDWADVGYFPNRCEGGTNLVAMEAMATGTPCILSANTGHLDLISRACPLSGPRPEQLEDAPGGKPAGPRASATSSPSGCFVLQRQKRLVAPVTLRRGDPDGSGSKAGRDQLEDDVRERYSGWGESEVEEGVTLLRRVWEDKESARRAGAIGGEVVRGELTWQHTRERLQRAVMELRENVCAS